MYSLDTGWGLVLRQHEVTYVFHELIFDMHAVQI